jgi:hypothetical protein
MSIDFSPVHNKQVVIGVYGRQFSVDQMREASDDSINVLLDIIGDTTDAEIAFLPHDPNANDPHAKPGEEHIGWTLGHLVAHVTATSEECAAIASILARGVPYGKEPRLRYETPWETITTREQAVKRLEESRRMRHGYLATFPEHPHYDNERTLPDSLVEHWGVLNAQGQFLLGLVHETEHHAQFREVKRQAREASLA